MTDNFQLLFQLLESDRLEVTGRTAPSVTPELRKKIAKFAAGESTEAEREEIKGLLGQKPELIPVLAQEAKALRTSEK